MLPHDLKQFYSNCNGFTIRWHVSLGEENDAQTSPLVGYSCLNPLKDVVSCRVESIHGQIGLTFFLIFFQKSFKPLDQDGASSRDGVSAGFVIEEVEEIGKVVMAYSSTSSPSQPSIYFQDTCGRFFLN